MMMMQSSNDNPDNPPRNHENQIMSEEQSIIISSICPISWKLYHNPFFASTNTYSNNDNNPRKLKHKQLQRKYSASAKYIHQLHSDLRTMSSSSNFINFDHQQARTQVAELKAELEMERKLRKKMEALNKKLSRELVDKVQKERMCVCEDLNKEISRLKEEMEKMKKDMGEERKMLRMAQVLREERVQMKLADAHLYFHHHFQNQFLPISSSSSSSRVTSNNVGDSKRFSASSEQKLLNSSKINVNIQRRLSPEAENPHIKQGIKGFVEFQRAVKAKSGSNNSSSTSCSSNNSKQSRDLGSFKVSSSLFPP